MRELLFRGKRKDTGEWIEAFSILKCQLEGAWQLFVGASKKAMMELDEHYNIHSAISEEDCLYYFVHPETMGQFTGLTDKNGKKIFEGDIIECWSEGVKARGTVQQRCDGLWIIYPAWQKNIMWGLCPHDDGTTTCEVIGNIHDNPELLEATDGEETN